MLSSGRDWVRDKITAHVKFRVDAVENRCPWCLVIRPMEWFEYQTTLDQGTDFQRVITKTTTKCRNCRRSDGQSPSQYRRRFY